MLMAKEVQPVVTPNPLHYQYILCIDMREYSSSLSTKRYDGFPCTHCMHVSQFGTLSHSMLVCTFCFVFSFCLALLACLFTAGGLIFSFGLLPLSLLSSSVGSPQAFSVGNKALFYLVSAPPSHIWAFLLTLCWFIIWRLMFYVSHFLSGLSSQVVVLIGFLDISWF